MRQTLDQQRANAAWTATPEKPSEKYVSLCSGAPVTILTNGLGPALAFFMAKAKDTDNEYQQLGRSLARWTLRTGNEADDSNQAKDLMHRITTASTDEYRRLTNEALAYLNWLKRFAVAREQGGGESDG